MSCTVCNHPQRQAIDLALLNRTATLAELSRQHQLSQSALHRHKQHLLKKMARTENRFQSLLREGCLVILYSFLERMMHITQTAAADGNARQLLQAVRQGTGIIKFMHKLDLTLDPDTVYRLLEAPQSVAQDSLLPTDLKFSAGSRQALADNLFAPCPEPASDQEQALEADAAADLADLDPELLQNLLANLSQSLDRIEIAPPPGKREKSGKKAKKGHGSNANYKKYQQDSRCEKNGEKFSRPDRLTAMPSVVQSGQPCLPNQSLTGIVPADQKSPGNKSSWIKDLDAGRLDINLLHAIGAGRPVDLDLAKYAPLA
jgi:hypothetical protein